MALNPQILIWARNTAGLSVEEAAHRLGFKNTRERTAEERLRAMEAGEEDPSRSVLLNMARIYHRSLLVFDLSRARLQDIVREIARFAGERNISRAMVAYKLRRVKIITLAQREELNRRYEDEWRAAQERSATKDKNEGGPSFYTVKRRRLGPALLGLVKNSLVEGFLTHTRAGRILGVKPRNVDPLIHMAGMRGSQ